jgi:hypothetical protein
MSKISDELREWSERNCGGYVDGELREELLSIANRIDSEMVELPKDRDGAPIHVGDTVYTTDGTKDYVERICIMANTTHVKCAFSDGRIIEFQPTELTHIRPDSWERIADELDDWLICASNSHNFCQITDDSENALRDISDRIRKLAKEQGDE